MHSCKRMGVMLASYIHKANVNLYWPFYIRRQYKVHVFFSIFIWAHKCAHGVLKEILYFSMQFHFKLMVNSQNVD